MSLRETRKAFRHLIEVKLAKIVFRVAAVYGVVVLLPLYFLFDSIGKHDPPAITHPAFYYGFVGLALAWQWGFYVISTDPARYRALILPSVLEKFSFGGAALVLLLQNRVHASDMLFPGIDIILGVLFAVCHFRLQTID